MDHNVSSQNKNTQLYITFSVSRCTFSNSTSLKVEVKLLRCDFDWDVSLIKSELIKADVSQSLLEVLFKNTHSTLHTLQHNLADNL